MMKTHWLLLAGGLFLVLCACDNWNLPVKDEMDFYRTMTPVDGWTELKERVEHSGAALIVLTKGFPAGSAAISVTRPLTISAAPGTRAVITRTSGANPLFTVAAGGGLTLGHPQGGTLVLDGNKEELGLVDSSLIGMSGGSCTMRDGAELRDNWKNGSGGAVFATVSTGSAVFTMSGGIISGNTASTSAGYSKVFGGGVAVNAAGDTSSVAFIMSGGTISGNTLSASETAEYSNFFGGGVAVSASNESRCEFTMSGGTISGNIVSTSAGYSESLGGGVAVFGNTAVNSNWGKFTMSGGTISGNKAVSTANSTNSASGGGGVYVGYNVFEFTMTGGTISGNTASSSNGSSNGGGVYLLPQQDPDNFENSTCTIKGGAISGNKAVSTADSADSFGGGVSVSGGPSSVSVTMEGGTIGGNSAVDSGGGVYVYRATFKKEQGAVVYGSDGIENRNTASTGSAVEVYKWDTTLVKIKTQDTTAWADEELSAVFNGTDYTFEGDWDE